MTSRIMHADFYLIERCHDVATTEADSGRFPRTRADNQSDDKLLSSKVFVPEVPRHHQLLKSRVVEFKSRPRNQLHSLMSHDQPVVHSDSEIMSGTPVFVGTRVPFQTLLDYLEFWAAPF
jgi:hypothetical protein